MCDKKNTSLWMILFVYMVCSAFQCNKRIGCGGTVYNFELGINAFPDLEDIPLGDTLWIKITNSTTILDNSSGREIDWSNASNLTTVMYLHKLSDLNEFSIGALNRFNVTLVNGKVVENNISDSFKEIKFEESDNQYKLRMGILPLEKGTYRLAFSNAANVYRNNDKCSKSNFILNFKDTDQHYYLSPTYQGGNLVGGDYYFNVE